MNCEKIQTLLITDYIDGETDVKTGEKIRAHLATCVPCREFEEALKKEAVEPLRSATRENPPDYVWERIKSRVAKERKSPLRIGIKILRPAFTVPAMALAILALVLITRLTLVGSAPVNSYMEEQVNFVMDLGANGSDTNGLGTSIEEFLL